ncbi:MAG: hypothetical protein ABI054_01785 [Planctomycetota bacterium]
MRPLWLSICAVVLAGLALAQDPQVPAAERVATVFQGLAKDSSDGTDFVETPGYRELVAALLEVKPADIEALHPVDLDFAQALADPDSLRGKWVRVRGYVANKKAISLSAPIGVQKKIERAFMELAADHVVACDLIGDPPSYKNQADTMEVCGVFYRTVSYEGKHGKQYTLPYVLARSMELIETPSSGMAKSLLGGGKQLYLGALLGFVGVVIFVMYLRHSARSEG